MTELPFHPLSELFPLMTSEEFEALKADVKEHGLIEVITTLDGQILDGRNRYRACAELGIEPKTIEWSGVGSAEAFVISHNLHRRHLNTSQRAMIAATLATRQKTDSLKKGSASPDTAKTASGISVGQAASMMNVSNDVVAHAKKVLGEGTAEEIEAIKAGKATVTTVARKIRKAVPAGSRHKPDPNRNAARVAAQRSNLKIWGQLRDALKGISGLPRASDVAKIARAHDRTHVVEAKLLLSIEWLTEFSDAWTTTTSDAEANSGGKNKSSRKAKEDAAA